MHSENFVMWPKIDFVFKEIMTNPKALKGFSSAALGILPDSIKYDIGKHQFKKSMRRKNKAFLMVGKIKYN